MKAWVVRRPGPIDEARWRSSTDTFPSPRPGEIGVRVRVCGVCRTDLHLAEGDLPPLRPDVVPGHEIVGVVDASVPGASRFEIGERVGIAWLRHTCGTCRFCLRGDENLCLAAAVHRVGRRRRLRRARRRRRAVRLPTARTSFTDDERAHRCCAPASSASARSAGRRCRTVAASASTASARPRISLRRWRSPKGATVHVMTRSAEARQLALDLGAASAADTFDPPPEPLDSAIIFAPAGEIVPAAMQALDRGGTLAIAGIHLSDIPALRYADHLFQERQVRSVTANTRRDGEEFLALADSIELHVETTAYPLERADARARDLAHDRVTGAAVITVSDEGR